MRMFFDRYDAGQQLAAYLHAYKGADAIVYAIPRGGVPVGSVIARTLHLPLDLVIARKIGHPYHPEAAICTVTETGERICVDHGLGGVDIEWIEHETERQRDEARRRRLVYKRSMPIRPATGKVAIIIDDGMATGLTMQAAIAAIAAERPAKIVVAVPVAPQCVAEELATHVDEVVTVRSERQFRNAVSAYYAHFPAVSDQEVMSVLADTEGTYLPDGLQPTPRSIITSN